MFKTILVALDGGEISEKALFFAQEIAARFGSEVRLLHVVSEFNDNLIAYDPVLPILREPARIEREPAIQSARLYLERLARALKEKQISVFSFVEFGDAADTILERAREKDVELIVMTSHSRRGLKRLVLGSVAEKVTRLAPCPTLTIAGESLMAPEAAGA